MILRHALIVLVLLVCGCRETQAERDTRAIRRAELNLVLPEGASPLSSYDRHYAVSGKSVRGIFIRSRDGTGEIALAASDRDLPFVADGGCGVVQARLDLGTNEWERPFCHGL